MAYPSTDATGTHNGRTAGNGTDDRSKPSLARSSKVYVRGTGPGVRVPMREVSQTPTKLRTAIGNGKGIPNPAITLYDTSGPYSDPDVGIDVRRGLAPLRQE